MYVHKYVEIIEVKSNKDGVKSAYVTTLCIGTVACHNVATLTAALALTSADIK